MYVSTICRDDAHDQRTMLRENGSSMYVRMYARTPVLAISYRDVPIIGSGKNTLQARRAGIRGGVGIRHHH